MAALGSAGVGAAKIGMPALMRQMSEGRITASPGNKGAGAGAGASTDAPRVALAGLDSDSESETEPEPEPEAGRVTPGSSTGFDADLGVAPRNLDAGAWGDSAAMPSAGSGDDDDDDGGDDDDVGITNGKSESERPEEDEDEDEDKDTDKHKGECGGLQDGGDGWQVADGRGGVLQAPPEYAPETPEEGSSAGHPEKSESESG